MARGCTVRDREFYINPEVDYYATILCKKLNGDITNPMSKDEFITGELRAKWTTEHPELVIAWDEYQTLKQQNKKAYEQLEKKVIEAVK